MGSTSLFTNEQKTKCDNKVIDMELWFKHGSGWHENQKLVNLIIETGYEGYGVYAILLELLLSHGGSLELNYKKLNYIVRCQTELLKQVITEFDLFEVVTNNDGHVCFYADWLLEDIKKAQKTSKARSASGKKGLLSRYGAEKASELANTVGVPESECLTIASENVANATDDSDRLDKIRTDIDIIDNDCCCIRAQENFERSKADVKSLRDLLPEMQGDKVWHESLIAMLSQVGVKVTAEQMPPLMNEFVQFQAARGKDCETMTFAEAKAWFFNWLMFKIEKTKKDGNNNRNCPAPSRSGTYAPSAAGYAGYHKSFAEQVRESKEKLLRDTARMLQNGELGSLGIGGGGLPRDLQP